jgi:hypothetical protein
MVNSFRYIISYLVFRLADPTFCYVNTSRFKGIVRDLLLVCNDNEKE